MCEPEVTDRAVAPWATSARLGPGRGRRHAWRLGARARRALGRDGRVRAGAGSGGAASADRGPWPWPPPPPRRSARPDRAELACAQASCMIFQFFFHFFEHRPSGQPCETPGIGLLRRGFERVGKKVFFSPPHTTAPRRLPPLASLGKAQRIRSAAIAKRQRHRRRERRVQRPSSRRRIGRRRAPARAALNRHEACHVALLHGVVTTQRNHVRPRVQEVHRRRLALSVVSEDERDVRWRRGGRGRRGRRR